MTIEEVAELAYDSHRNDIRRASLEGATTAWDSLEPSRRRGITAMVRFALEFPPKLGEKEGPADVVAWQFRCEVERLRKFVPADEISPARPDPVQDAPAPAPAKVFLPGKQCQTMSTGTLKQLTMDVALLHRYFGEDAQVGTVTEDCTLIPLEWLCSGPATHDASQMLESLPDPLRYQP